MASTKTKALLLSLQRLAVAYPDRTPDSATLAVILESLADVPPWLVRRAVETHIRRSSWFPKVADLRRVAGEIAGIRDPADSAAFASLPPHSLDYLTAQVVALEDAFYDEGRLEAAEWEALIHQLDLADRPHRAAATREKLHRLQGLALRRPSALMQTKYALAQFEDPLRQPGD